MNRTYFLFFTLTTAVFLGLGYWLSHMANAIFTWQALLGGVVFLALVSLQTFFLSIRFVNAKNPNRFVRGIMGATFLKFFLCIIAAIIWLMRSGKQLNKPDLFALMGVYIAYTILESLVLSARSKRSH